MNLKTLEKLETLETQPDDFPVRTSEVGGIYVNTVGTASVVQIGDRAEVNASLRALAVQRASDHLISGNVYFESYDIFDRDTPTMNTLINELDTEPDYVRTTNCLPTISVGCIEIIAVSSAALLLVGNGLKMKGEARVKHVRQFSVPTPVPTIYDSGA
ncbi:spore germination protein GerPE [Paenibacillus albus]|uniref:Spore germination protein GerPE n=1 Tax=Paenibacillus albus TaxID=2495582 RepID=A0A3Q8X7T9_9BACL|nr:spore germination protein GerPE [Paenibacillus albus]AZN42125.1 spore germination protein GerPE [Paenibacillus albus]